MNVCYHYCFLFILKFFILQCSCIWISQYKNNNNNKEKIDDTNEYSLGVGEFLLSF